MSYELFPEHFVTDVSGSSLGISMLDGQPPRGPPVVRTRIFFRLALLCQVLIADRNAHSIKALE